MGDMPDLCDVCQHVLPHHAGTCSRSEEPQTAMLLTETEWADLAIICGWYRTMGANTPPPELVRRHALCERIEHAANGRRPSDGD